MIREVYQFQKEHNSTYARWLHLLGQYDQPIEFIEDLAFLPISLFKNHKISCFEDHEVVFRSSSTTGLNPSYHYIHKEDDYIQTCKTGFNRVFSSITFDYLAALLPSYLDRSGSGLIHMVSKFMEDPVGKGKFYNTDFHQLIEDLERRTHQKQTVLLFAVTFGLLELLKIPNKIRWNYVHIIETGGMKGHGKEITRQELHQVVTQQFSGVHLHSEYGMTELCSQAYALHGAIFQSPPWMKILIQDPADPKNFLSEGKTGRICIIDLMNYHSCSFIATDDLGKRYADGSFEVLGRFDHAEIRGCNQLL